MRMDINMLIMIMDILWIVCAVVFWLSLIRGKFIPLLIVAVIIGFCAYTISCIQRLELVQYSTSGLSGITDIITLVLALTGVFVVVWPLSQDHEFRYKHLKESIGMIFITISFIPFLIGVIARATILWKF